MNMKTQTTSHQIVKQVLAEMSQMDITDRIRVFGFVLSLYLRKERYKAMNLYLSLVVLALLFYLLLG
jgi:hypothetical protein